MIEWWYFHAHLAAADGTPYCAFAALFRVRVGGELLCHAHASLLCRGETLEGGTFAELTIN